MHFFGIDVSVEGLDNVLGENYILFELETEYSLARYTLMLKGLTRLLPSLDPRPSWRSWKGLDSRLTLTPSTEDLQAIYKL